MAYPHPSPLVRELMSAAAVRRRCDSLLALAEDDALAGFRVDRAMLDPVADRVAALTRDRFPDLDIPFHSRWRHFQVAGRDRWAPLCAALPAAQRLAAAFDLVVVSVLLDAGAGADWHYRDAVTGTLIGRSEGLAAASVDMFAAGAFSSDPAVALRADAAGLQALDLDQLARGFQAGGSNPLVGLEGRLTLLNRLGQELEARPELFGTDPPRIGGLGHRLSEQSGGAPLPAPRILEAVLDGLGAIWPGRHELQGANLGDTWRHPGLAQAGPGGDLIPFHKLSQWLSYSLVEPLLAAGVEVTDLDGLTGLAEYRNGGLFLDCGVLLPRDPSVLGRWHAVDSELVVEWRALTVALLDELAPLVRARLDCDAASLPLAKVLEGGTWSAGRAAARERRSDGGPPLQVISDGTVF